MTLLDPVLQLSGPRREIVEQVLRVVADNISRSEAPLQHILLTGGPGSGKTALLNVIVGRLQDDPQFSGVTVSYLASTMAAQAAAPETFIDWAAEAASGHTDTPLTFPWRGGDEAAWEAAITRLEAALDRQFGVGKGLAVLLLDDFEDILGRVFPSQSAESRLRRLLQENPRLMVVAATRDSLVQSDYERPLFQIFQPVDLPPFDPRDALKFVDAPGTLSARGAANLAAAYFILGPFQPRRLVLAHKLANLAPSASALLRALAKAEELSFERQARQLPVRPARLLDALLVGGEPARPATLADRLGTVQSDIAPTLRDLLAAGAIERSEGSGGRMTFYQAADRLFAIWYLDVRGAGLALGPPAANFVSAGLLAQVASNPAGTADGVQLARRVLGANRRADAFKLVTEAWSEWGSPEGQEALDGLVAELVRRPANPSLLLDLSESAEARDGWTAVAEILKAATFTRFQDPEVERTLKRPINLDRNYRAQPDIERAIATLRSDGLSDFIGSLRASAGSPG